MSLVGTLLYFDGCPSWQTAVENLHAAAQRAGVEVGVSTLAVETEQDAHRLGFTGSPTVGQLTEVLAQHGT